MTKIVVLPKSLQFRKKFRKKFLNGKGLEKNYFCSFTSDFPLLAGNWEKSIVAEALLPGVLAEAEAGWGWDGENPSYAHILIVDASPPSPSTSLVVRQLNGNLHGSYASWHHTPDRQSAQSVSDRWMTRQTEPYNFYLLIWFLLINKENSPINSSQVLISLFNPDLRPHFLDLLPRVGQTNRFSLLFL